MKGSRLLVLAAAALLGALFGCDSNTNSGTIPVHVTQRVSLSAAGEEANGASQNPSISEDGRYVAFESRATNLHPEDTDVLTDVFVKDRTTGGVELVSRATGIAGAKGNGNSSQPSISLNGRYVAFESEATNLDPDDANARSDIYVRDLVLGRTTLVSRAPDNPKCRETGRPFTDLTLADISSLGNATDLCHCRFPSLSDDGTRVAYNVVGVDGAYRWVLAHTDVTSGRSTVLEDFTGLFYSGRGPGTSISGDGQWVAGLTQGVVSQMDAVGASVQSAGAVNTETGEVEALSVCSEVEGGRGDDVCIDVAVSGNGRFFAFSSAATNLLGTGMDGNAKYDVFLHDSVTGTTARISVSSQGAESADDSDSPSISTDGRFIAFVSDAFNLDNEDSNDARDVFLHDTLTGITDRVSVRTYGGEAKRDSENPSLSGDGSFISFDSMDKNMVEGDTNGVSDVFVRSLGDPSTAPPVTAPSDGWTIQWNRTDDDMYAVDALDSATAWAAGRSGTVMYTTDGTTLKLGGVPTNRDLNDISFCDASNGLVVGAGGTILGSSDGGVHWSLQSGGVTTDLQGVLRVSATHGFCVGDGGVVLNTTDGGTTWAAQNSGTTADLNAVSFFDINTGWIAGNDGVILSTTDGGVTWTTRTSGTGEDLYGICFPTLQDGWGVGTNGIIRETTDGGTTWGAGRTMGYDLFDASFPTVLEGAISGHDGWTCYLQGHVPFSYYAKSPACRSVKLLPGVLWAIHADGGIGKSTDTGTTWSFLTAPVPVIEDVTSADATNAWITGQDGIMMSTTDRGATWNLQNSGTTNDLHVIEFLDSQNGWAAGRDPATPVLRGTVDGGTTWFALTPPALNVKALDFVTSNIGFAAAYEGAYRTDDGGTSWTQISIGIELDYRAISFLDDQNGWTVGIFMVPTYAPCVMRTTDGGGTWTSFSPGPTDTVYSGVFALDMQRIWASGCVNGTDGIILFTDDGGSTWSTQLQVDEYECEITDLRFFDVSPDPPKGWAVCKGLGASAKSALFYTEDGGATWKLQYLGSSADLAFSFASQTEGWLMGKDPSVILHTATGGE